MATATQTAAATVGTGSASLALGYGVTNATRGNNGAEEEAKFESEFELINEALTGNKKTTNDEPEDVVTHELTSPKTLDPAYTDKFLGITKRTHLSKLVKSTKETNNDSWWDWAFKNKYSQKEDNKLDPIFEKVTTAFSASSVGSDKDETALNQACEKAYKQDKDKYKFDQGYLLKNIGQFCTTGDKEFKVSEPEATPLGETDKASYTGKLAGAGKNKNKLVKHKSETTDFNELWWKWSHIFRFPTAANKVSLLSDVFKKVKSAYASDEGEKTSLNWACNEAYKKDNPGLTGNNSKVFDDVKSFCAPSDMQDLELPQAAG